MDFTEYIDLAAERLGGKVLAANDEFFAPKENLLKASAPVWIEDKYTDVGKWMDGWETRRRRTPGYDLCIVQLGLPGIIHGFVVDTAHFKGNYPDHCEIEACALDGGEPNPNLRAFDGAGNLYLGRSTNWRTLLPKSPLGGDTRNSFPIQSADKVTHLCLKIYPDGGVARLRVHGEVIPDWPSLTRTGREIDLAAVEHGGWIIVSSDMFFGSRNNLILPGRSTGMHDGWETRRRRGPGHDWCVVRLGAPGKISRVEVDTSYFKGNFPESCSLEVGTAPRELTDPAALGALPWQEILTRTKLQANSRHVYEKELLDSGEVTHARFHIYPDGGVARLRIFGTLGKRDA
jgi:allantoicase